MSQLLKIGSPDSGGFNGGVHLGVPNADLSPNESPEAYNYLVSDSGLDSCPGCIVGNSMEVVAGKPIQALGRFFDGITNRTLVKCGTSVWDVQPNGAHTELASGLPEGDMNFEFWQNKYLFADGTDIWSGTTGTASKISQLDQNGDAITGTKVAGDYVLQHNQRLWILDKSTGAVTFSETDYPDRFHVDAESGNVDSILDNFDKGDGNKLTAFISYAGKLFVFKEHKGWIVAGDDSEGTLSRTPDSYPYGALGQKAIVNCSDGFLRGIDPRGVWEYSDTTGFRRISRNIDYELKQIAPDNRSKVAMGFFGKYLLISYTYGATATGNNRIMLADMERRNSLGHPCWMPRHGWNISSFAVYDDDETLHGGRSTGGYIDKLFYGESDNGEDIECFWRSMSFQPAPGIECQLDKIRGVLGYGASLSVGVFSDVTTNTNYNTTKTYPTVGTPWGDETEPDLDGFVLGDEDDPTFGDDLVSEDDVGGPYTFENTIPGGKYFREIQVTIGKNSSEQQRVEFVEIYFTPLRAI